MKRIAVLLCVVSVVLLCCGGYSLAGKCPECNKAGQKSKVNVDGATSTLLTTQQYYDKEGNYHFEDPNTTTINYTCSRGHKFSNSSTNSSGAWIVMDGKDINAITNIMMKETNSWFKVDCTQDVVLSYDKGEVTFFPGSSNQVVFVNDNGRFKVLYDCEVDEASEAVLKAIEQAGDSMGYIVLDKHDAKLMADSLKRLQEWEKAAAEYRALIKKLEDR